MNVTTGRTDGAIQLAYEDLGPADAEPVVLIMGFACQLTRWPDPFCARLVDAGYRVIRFDNRDIGLSTKLSGERVGGSQLLRLARYQFGLPSEVPYTLVEMSEDVAQLLDHLELDAVHLVGASMGGMIAQVFAGRHPSRIRSLGIIFSTTNQPLLPPPHPAALRALISSPGANPSRDRVVEHTLAAAKVLAGPRYPQPDDERRARIAADYDRSYYPAGLVRQFAAISGTGSLLPWTRRIAAPTAVLHGTADPLVRPSGGKAVAEAIPDARLHLIDGMGHDLPPELFDRLTGLLVDNFARA